ncbi:MAG: hypothetical protein WC968_01310 [Bacilli bacterium]
MQTANTLQRNVFSALIDLIDERMDPYSVKITYDDIVAQIIKKYIRESKSNRIYDIAIFETINHFLDSNFSIENTNDFNTLLKMSSVQSNKFHENKRKTKKNIDNLLKISKDNLPFLFFDFDSESIQLTDIKAWPENKKIIQNFLFQDLPKGNGHLTYNEYLEILKKMYNEAPDGYQMTMLHMFGIRYGDDLKNYSIKNLAFEATGKDFLNVEIGKGIKLSKFVKIIEDITEVSVSGAARDIKNSGNEQVDKTNGEEVNTRFNFFKRGIKKGAEIVFAENESFVAYVENERKVMFEGRLWYLSPLTRELFTRLGKVNSSGAYQGPLYFKFNGKRLTEIPEVTN